ncbi:hypothetical protein, partial [Dactylosporangium siamense]|uniref:hypothetical protein n=1 Tax=Dactylosporangium siamense TaxID=685454 RepID=UPI001941700B
MIDDRHILCGGDRCPYVAFDPGLVADLGVRCVRGGVMPVSMSLWLVRRWRAGALRRSRVLAAAVCGVLVGSAVVVLPARAQGPSWPVPAAPAAGASVPVTPVVSKASAL